MSIKRALLPRWAAAGMLCTGLALATVAAMPVIGEVGVVLEDYKIKMPASIEAGATVFTIENMGEVAHGFSIRSTGPEGKELAALATPVEPGQSARLEAELQPGNYEVVDPEKDHKDKGMVARLEVTAPPN